MRIVEWFGGRISVTLLALVILAAAITSGSLISTLQVNAANLCVTREDVSAIPCASPYFAKTWLVYRMQSPADAVETLKAFLAQRPVHLVARLRLGEAYWAQGQTVEAVSVWQSAGGVDQYLANRHVYAIQSGDTAAVQESIAMAQALSSAVNKDLAPMYVAQCEALRKENQPAQALPWCEAAAQTRNNGWTLLDLASVQYDLGDYAASERSLQQLVAYNDENFLGLAYQKLGQIYLKQDRLEEGIAAYKNALEYGRQEVAIYRGLAKAYLQTGQMEQACWYFKQAVAQGYSPTAEEHERYSKCK